MSTYATLMKWQSTTYASIFEEAKKLLPDEFKEDAKLDITRQDIDAVAEQNIPCFTLHNVLTPNECNALIQASEKLGYEAAEKYCHLYNDRFNDRTMSDDPEFTDLVFKRVKKLLPKSLTAYRVKGTLQTQRLNTRWRYCRYGPKMYFGPHCDGIYHVPLDSNSKKREMSYLTFMLYLNGPKKVHPDIPTFTGGNTNFLNKQHKIVHPCVPEAGSALVFVQEHMKCLHEGEALTSGAKYILRSDVIFSIEDS